MELHLKCVCWSNWSNLDSNGKFNRKTIDKITIESVVGGQMRRKEEYIGKELF